MIGINSSSSAPVFFRLIIFERRLLIEPRVVVFSIASLFVASSLTDSVAVYAALVYGIYLHMKIHILWFFLDLVGAHDPVPQWFRGQNRGMIPSLSSARFRLPFRPLLLHYMWRMQQHSWPVSRLLPPWGREVP